MAKFAKHVNSLVAGELSPRVYGRTDIEQYGNGARELLNKIVRPQGGAFRRGGSVYICDGPYDSNMTKAGNFDTEVRSIPFKYSRTEGAVIVLTTGNNGLNSYGIAIWDPLTKTWINPTISLSTDYIAFAGWSSQAELDEVQFAQSGDVVALVSSKNPPVFLFRNSLNSYTLKDIYSLRDVFPAATSRVTYAGDVTAIQEKVSPSGSPSASQPWYNFPYQIADSTTYGTLSAAATTGSMVITSTGKFASYGMIGTILRMTKSGVTGFVRVDSISNFSMTVTVLKALGGTGTQDSWEFQDFGPHLNLVSDNWPRTVAFHDQRIWYGGTKLKPNTLWASQVGDFTEMMIVRPADDANFASLSADRPFSFTLASNQVDDIQWMLSGQRSIFIGTSGGEWIGESSGDTILGPLNPNFSSETSYGSKLMQAINANGSIIFVDQSAQKLREFIYNRNEDAYRAVNLSYFADHMIRKGMEIYSDYSPAEIKQVAVQLGDNTLIWVRDSNGMLHVFQKERDYGTLAWSTVKFGGAWDSDGRPPKVLDICAIPNGTANGDDLYAMIQRYLDGSSYVYFEKIGAEFAGPSLNNSSLNIEDQPVFSDSAQMVHALSGPKFYSRYVALIDGAYWTTDGTGTGTGSPTANEGLLLTGGTLKYVSYHADNAMLVQTGTIVLEVTPNYTGTPAADRAFYAISKSNSDDDNLVTLIHKASSGDLVCTIKDSTGANSRTLTKSAWAPTSGVKYQVTVSFNCTTGFYSMWINGVCVATNGSGAMTRDIGIGQFVVGTNYALALNSDFTINKIGIATGAWGTTNTSRFKPAFAIDIYVMGIDHQRGDAVVLGDGQKLLPKDFRYQQLDSAITNCAIVGIPYTSRVKTMDIEAGSILGSAQGDIKKAHEVTMRFERTVGAKFGYDENALDELDFAPYDQQSGQPIPLYTGDITKKFPATYSRNLTVVVQQDDPMPCTVTSIVVRGQTYD